MKNYLTVNDIDSLQNWVSEARELKLNPFQDQQLGQNRTLVLLFFNNSLRTRLSTQKAAQYLGMNVMVMNFSSEGWVLEYDDGIIMDRGAAEHIKEAAKVVSQYADIIGIRAFAGLKDKEKDQAEHVIQGFKEYASVPIVNLESSISHPLQALADALTISEHAKKQKPKVVLSWAPHPKPLPHAVANSFVSMMRKYDTEFVISHPKGYELNPDITKNIPIEYDHTKALKDADFVYVKSWSSYKQYGQVLSQDDNWMMTVEKLGKAKFMHCLPVRRNIVADDAVLDGPQSLVIEQSNNRTFAAQLVLKKLLEDNYKIK